MSEINISLDSMGSSKLAPQYDIAIIGAGPAGLTAAIYTARARINGILIEKKNMSGGQVLTTEKVENYPGFDEPIGGFELMKKFREQAENFGAKITNTTVESLQKKGKKYFIRTDSGDTETAAVIIASGASPRKTGAKGEKKFIGRGVSFCATCDGALYRNKSVAVIGGGDAGIEEGLFLTRFASKVTVIEMMNHLAATKILQERANENPKMDIILSHMPVEIIGDSVVSGIMIKNLVDGSISRIDVGGIFVYVGIEPNTGYIEIDELEKDKSGFIITDCDMRTVIPGLFAAGDVRSKILRQVSTAVGDGAAAQFAAQRYLENI